eukprot:CAMPEP_0198143320 /NCGR_PEP_ID=MMETSP1443-20131203/6336_1 /TAXON_ID=186043 /ORGANISM="Entomoneis sp., Strain CCMP2396" /LENGTH=418 /DNA_ID=CAMNT_0043806541 /DNA_START=108 /DNA_END=1361 /DNA_ORIENTATION=+
MSRSSIKLLSPVWTHLTKIQPVRGSGIYLYDADGTQYMDFTSGIGVLNTGHCHPKVVKAIQDQAENLIFGQMNIVIPPATVELSHKLDEITPPSIDRYFFSNSGAEAVEASVKLARHATGKQNIIVFQGSYHGRTAQTMAMTTAKYIYRVNYQPLPAGVFVAPYPFSYYYGWEEEQTVDFCLQELKTLLHGQSRPEETAAIVIEPVLGEGGYVQAPPRFMKELRKLCSEHDILLVADEVQAGFGRTGKFFSFEHSDIEPDIIIMAKGLGSGMPISAIASRSDLMDNNKWIPGSHGGTYGGGSAVASAAAVATVNVIHEEGLLGNATDRGAQLVQGLRALQDKYPGMVGDVRGYGLMVATELDSKETVKAVQQACLRRNLLILSCGTYEKIIRWIPPLIVDASQIDSALTIIEEAFKEV